MSLASTSNAGKLSQRKPLVRCIAAVVALSAPVAAVHAATWFVNDCTDGTAAGQFRWATNGAVSGDTIDLTTQLAPSYLNCTGAANGFNHTLQLTAGTVTLATGVTIQGPGKNELALSGVFNSGNRIVTSNGDITINDLGFKYGGSAGSTVMDAGGCVWASNNITLTNVRLHKCSAYSTTGWAAGGAVYSFVGGVTMTGSSVDSSSATSVSGRARGGSVYGFKGVTLTNSTITNSTATTQTGQAEGGGVFAFSNGNTDVKLYDSRVTGTASVSTVAGGHAYGGGIMSRHNAYLTNSYARGEASTQSTDAARGGSIWSLADTTLDNSITLGGSAYSKSGAANGGNIYAKGFARLYSSSVQLGRATGGLGRGGGVYSGGGFTSKYSAIHGNSAASGGGGVINKDGNSFIRGTTVSHNSGLAWSGLDLFGGGATDIAIINSTIVHNTATSALGSAAMYLKSHDTTLNNSTIAYNSGGGGSAVSVYAGNAGSTFNLNSTLIASNTSGAGRNDLRVVAPLTFTPGSSHNFVRDPGSGVPADTIVGKCPLLKEVFFGGAPWAFFMQRPKSASLALDAGSNPGGLTADQRGGAIFAVSPPRASGPGPANASPVADIGAYEVFQDDALFDDDFETCQ